MKENNADYKQYVEKNFEQFILDLDSCNPMSLNLTDQQIFQILSQVQSKLEPHLKAQDKLKVTLQASYMNDDAQSINGAIQVNTLFSDPNEAMMNFNATISENAIALQVLKKRELNSIRKKSLFGDDHPLVLVVDDDLGTRSIISTWITKYNKEYHVILACDGNEAIRKFKEFIHFDLIIMDMNMPNLDGIKATAAIRQIENDNDLQRTRIIAITAENTNEATVKGYDMDGLCKKPILRFDILHEINPAEFPKEIVEIDHSNNDEESTSSFSPM